MKKIILIIITGIITTVSSAQRITVDTGTEELGEGYNAAYILFIPHASEKSVERKWESFLKDNDAKVRTSKRGINGQNAIIKRICNDTLQVFSRIAENADGVSLLVAFNKYGTFISPITFSDESKTIERMLHDFALPVSKDGLADKVKAATKVLESKVGAHEDVVKRNERLSSDNEKMKNQINENEREIKDNEGKISSLNAEIENQKKAVDLIKSKEKDLE